MCVQITLKRENKVGYYKAKTLSLGEELAVGFELKKSLLCAAYTIYSSAHIKIQIRTQYKVTSIT